ncbi:MAG: type II toxin-antitoxin system ParD family antitoxin [Rhodospirillaceae bacterium]|nr:type II toxin-antitoxin system ParD family antitoxin [Rhodospirillaceae bacterium]
MKIVLTKPYTDFVKERIDEGVYENASEAVRDALRLMADRVFEKKASELKIALREGLDSGVDDTFSFAKLNASIDSQARGTKSRRRRAA